jgi:hypothetical protein
MCRNRSDPNGTQWYRKPPLLAPMAPPFACHNSSVQCTLGCRLVAVLGIVGWPGRHCVEIIKKGPENQGSLSFQLPFGTEACTCTHTHTSCFVVVWFLSLSLRAKLEWSMRIGSWLLVFAGSKTGVDRVGKWRLCGFKAGRKGAGRGFKASHSVPSLLR